MPGYSTYDMVGVKESVADIISNLSPTKTPFQTLIGSEKIKSRKHEWQEDDLAAVRDSAEVEGFEASDVAITPTRMRENNTQILSKTIRVTATADEVDTYGRDKELAYQLRKASTELKRDLENTFVGTGQVRVAGNSTTARRMAGVQAMIDASVTVTAPDGDTSTAGVQKSALTEDLFTQANQALYNAGSEADIFMIKPNDALRVAAFANRSDRGRDLGASGKKIVNVVEILETPFGEQRVVLNRWLRKTDALLLDASNWKKLILRNWFRETLAKTGDSTRVMLVGEFSLKHSNFAASGLITNLLD